MKNNILNLTLALFVVTFFGMISRSASAGSTAVGDWRYIYMRVQGITGGTMIDGYEIEGGSPAQAWIVDSTRFSAGMPSYGSEIRAWYFKTRTCTAGYYNCPVDYIETVKQ